MPSITVRLDEGDKTFEVTEGIRLTLALEQNGIDVSHRCGGFAKCTTCKCEIIEGEPSMITEAEKDKNVENARLSCQILVNNDMVVRPLVRVKDASWNEPGKTLENEITPQPVWLSR